MEVVMPKTSKNTAAESMQAQGYEGHFDRLAGGYTIGFETYTQDADLAPLFRGLPDDRCQCPHWGYVLKGKLAYRTQDGEEVFNAGDAYYVPPGHTPTIFAGTEVVEFSPTDQLQQTLEVVEKNLTAGG
jgi:hypothetical protein